MFTKITVFKSGSKKSFLLTNVLNRRIIIQIFENANLGSFSAHLFPNPILTEQNNSKLVFASDRKKYLHGKINETLSIMYKKITKIIFFN